VKGKWGRGRLGGGSGQDEDYAGHMVRGAVQAYVHGFVARVEFRIGTL
jgi:hypothetical protein